MFEFRNKQWKVWLWGVILISSLVVMACSLTQCITSPKTIKEGKAFEPTRDMVIEGGDYHIPSMNIPEDVNVTFEEDVNLTVDGDANISGEIQGNCTGITMQVGGAFNLKGDLSNTGCEGEETADITLNLAGDQPIQFGEEGQEITVDGDMFINIGDVQGLESTPPLPFEPAQESTPPVCTLSADTLVADLTEEGYAYVSLWAECLDPDDGIVETLTLEHHLMNSDDGIYALDNSFELHDNGETILGLEEPGVHFISLWAEDDEGAGSYPSTITVFVVDPAMEEHDEIGIAIEQDWLFYEQGSELQLESLIETTYPEADLEYLWSIYLEDTEMFSSESDPLIDLDQPGVMDISLEVYFANSFLGYASRTLYVTPEMTSGSIGSGLAKPNLVTQYDCGKPPNDAITFNKVRISFKNSGSLIARVLPVTSRPIMILPPAIIWAGDGKDGDSEQEPVFARGRNGGKGGSILIHNWNGDIVLCNGAEFTAGDGGNGGDATATKEQGRRATAIGGYGGRPGSILFRTYIDYQLVIVNKGTPMIDTEVTMTLGKGGDGGDATAEGGDGEKNCNTPTNGRWATARGGRGGSMKYTVRFDKTRFDNGGRIDIILPAGAGGDGGNADAEGGKGGNAANPGGAVCNSCIAGKNGGKAKAIGGKGGSAYLRVIKPNVNTTVVGVLTGGKGGNAKAVGGNGGDASDCPKANKGKPGGKGGNATAVAGKGGKTKKRAGRGAVGGTAGSMAGNGGTGGKGLMQGGLGGDKGKGWKGAKDGEKGSKGGMFGDFADMIKKVQVFLEDPITNTIKLTIQYALPGWDWATGTTFVTVELEFMEELFTVDLNDTNYVADETIEIEIMLDQPLESGTATLALIDEDGNRTEAFEFKVEVPEIVATEEPQAQQGSPPVITAVEFPDDNIMNPITIESIGIPADGTKFGGWIHFEDEEGDTSYLSFEPMEVDSIFQGFGFYLEEGFLEGDYFEGKVQFFVWCGTDSAQQRITLQVMLQDAAGNWSEPAILMLWCE